MSKIRELNLVPQHIKHEKENKEKISKYIAGGIIICCAVGGAAIYLNSRVSDLEKQKVSLQQEIQKTQERFNEKSEMDLKILDLKARIDKIENLSVLKKKDTKIVLTDLSKKFPAGLKLKTLNFVNTEQDVKDGFLGTITMSGGSNKRNEIEEFWANLREDKRYYISHISGITKSEDKDTGSSFYTFDLTMKVKEN